MEIYNIFDAIVQMRMQLYGLNALRGEWRAFVLSVGISFGIVIGLFLLQGAGLYTMAKERDVKGKWLAFVPFGNFLLVERLAGQCTVFGHKMKHAGVYVFVASIVTSVICFAVMACEIYIFIGCADQLVVMEEQNKVWFYFNNPTTLQAFAYKFYQISGLLLSLFQLVYEVLVFLLLISLYKSYATKNYMLLAIVAIFIPISRYVVIFCVRNNRAIDYDEYLRKRREAYMRSAYPYGRPSAPYDPYNGQFGAHGQNRNQSAPEDPFSEFGDGKANGDPFTPDGGESGESKENTDNGSDTGDGFFD